MGFAQLGAAVVGGVEGQVDSASPSGSEEALSILAGEFAAKRQE
jgi:hypothetical protein